MLKSKRKLFNRGWLDRKDPVEGLGGHVQAFSVSRVFQMTDNDQVLKVSSDIYEEVVADLQRGSLADTKCSVVAHEDAQLQGTEEPRKYITLSRETARGTRITLLMRFIPHGRFMYMGVDSYVLGAFDWWAFTWRFLALMALLFYIFSPIFYSSSPTPYPSDLIPASIKTLLNILSVVSSTLLALIFFRTIGARWIAVARNLRAEGNLVLALRQTFYVPIDQLSFNSDDIMMTLKSSLTTALRSTITVGEQHGIKFPELTGVIELIGNVTHINNYTNTVNGIMAGTINGAVQQLNDGKQAA